MPTQLDRAMRPTIEDIERIKEAVRAKGIVLPIRGGDGTDESSDADEAAKQAAEEEAAKQQEEEKHLNDAGKEALRKEREARKAAAKRASEMEAELNALRAKQTEADAAKAKAEEEAAIKRGEFEKIASERAETIKAKDDELKAANARIEALATALKPGVDAAWKDAPDAVTKLYRGDDADVLAKQAFLAEYADLIDQLTGKQEETKDRFRRASGKTPPVVNGKPEIQSPLSAREIRG